MTRSARLACAVVVAALAAGCTPGGRASVAPVVTPSVSVPTLNLPAPSTGPSETLGSSTPLPARAAEPTPAARTVTVTMTPPPVTTTQFVPGSPAQAAASQCTIAGAAAASCRSAYTFLDAYFDRDDAKNLTRAEMPAWFTAPADFYGQQFTFDQLTAALTKPSDPAVVYGTGRLAGFAASVPLGSAVGTQLTFVVPYTDHGAAKTVQVRYTLVPGPGGQGWRITKIEEL